ncbi:MAG: glycosyltransferase [Candidatus Dojkabacteria bacterium]|nr:MAG: glycosyltransferase [Candidatus Dojkabacteria bacterium]
MAKLKVDIVIPAYFGLGITTRSVYSVLNQCDFDKYDLKLILVDDSGDPEYGELLSKQVADFGSPEKIAVLKHGKNKGFIEACYTGVEYRDSDYKLLLNSDTLMLSDSLDKMIATAESEDEIAIVNPVTNQIAVINAEMPAGFNIYDMQEAAGNFPKSKSDFIDLVTSVGFCMLIKSKYIEKLGFFDRIFGYGYGEDTDLHFRYVDNGLRAVIATDSFVYHRGEGSFSDRDEKVLFARKVVFERYQELYDKTFPEFAQKTIVNKIKSHVNEYGRYLTKVLFLTHSNSLADPEHRYAHVLANTLLEFGIPANVAYKHRTTELSFADDRLYTPIEISEIKNKYMPLELIVVTDRLLYRSALDYASALHLAYGTSPKIVFGSSYYSKLKDALSKGVYDEYIREVDQQPLIAPEVADILSNIGYKKNGKTGYTKIMFSSDTSYDRMIELARTASNLAGSYHFYKFGDKQKTEIVGSHEVSIFKWPGTEKLYELLKDTSVYINLSDQISTSELQLVAYANVTLLLLDKHKAEVELMEKFDVEYTNDIDDISLVEKLGSILVRERGINIEKLYYSFSSYDHKEAIVAVFNGLLESKVAQDNLFMEKISEYISGEAVDELKDLLEAEESSPVENPRSFRSDIISVIPPRVKSLLRRVRSKLR